MNLLVNSKSMSTDVDLIGLYEFLNNREDSLSNMFS